MCVCGGGIRRSIKLVAGERVFQVCGMHLHCVAFYFLLFFFSFFLFLSPLSLIRRRLLPHNHWSVIATEA